MKDAKEIEGFLHSLHLTALNLYRFCRSDAFKRAYTVADERERTAATLLIKNQNQSKLTEWVEAILQDRKEYEYLSVRHLRGIAYSKGILNYHSMTHVELVNVLINKEKNVNTIEQNLKGNGSHS